MYIHEIIPRADKKSYHLYAVFPYSIDLDRNITVFNGCHSSACWDWVRETRPATKRETETIIKNLIEAGYKRSELKIIKRRNLDKVNESYERLVRTL